MFENNSSDEEEDDDEGHLFQSQFPIHDLCDARVHFGNGGVGVAGENLERLRKALTFPKKKKKNDGEEGGGGGGGEDDGDDDEEEGDDGDE